MADQLVLKYKAKIDAIVSGTDVTELRKGVYQDPIAEMLSEWTTNVIGQMQKQLDLMTTAKGTMLGKEIKPTEAKITGGNIYLEVSAPFYWKFVNFGVTGLGFPPNSKGSEYYGTQVFTSSIDYNFKNTYAPKAMRENLLEWLPSTGLFGGLPNKEYEQIAWGMGVNIKRRGIEAKPFVDIVFDEKKVVDKFTKQLGDVTQYIITEVLENGFKATTKISE